MPVFNYPKYKPPLAFRNSHLATAFPSFFRKVQIDYNERRRISLSDGDFVDIDLSSVRSDKAVILCHGLEGNSHSKYILGMSRYLNQNGFDTIALNYRGCSGELNLKPKMYNSGATDDLSEMITAFEKDYAELHLIGFSLGGNMLLKYLGEGKFAIPENLRSAVAFSVPCDLNSSIYVLESPQTYIYRLRFLISLRKKVKEKHRQFPEIYDLAPLESISNLREFDDHYTAPIHGYVDAKDYYTQCSSLQFLNSITIPSLLVNALDDPFLSPECMPFKEAKNSDSFYFYPSKYGGHVGFPSLSKTYWSEQIALDFINQYSS